MLIGYDYIRRFGRDRSVGQTVVIKVEQGGTIGLRKTVLSVNCFCRAIPLAGESAHAHHDPIPR